MFTRNFPDMLYILRIMTIWDDTHNTRVPCYAYRAARLEEVFSSAFFVTAMNASLVPENKVTSIFTRKYLNVTIDCGYLI